MTATPTPTGWWSRVGPVKRVVTVVVVLAVGINVGLAALDSVVGGEPGGPTGSSFATGDDGVAAWGDLLRARGVEAEALREPLGEADLPSGGTVVLVEPADAPTPESLAALADHLVLGGRVVAVGAAGSRYASPLLGTDLGWTGDGVARPSATGPALSGLSDLRSEGTGSFSTPGAATIEAGPESSPVIVTAGALVVVADPTLLDNAHLDQGDNAALAVLLAGDGPVAFAEAEHGYGAARGLAAVPGPWKAAAVGLVLAALLGFWSAGQRLGPAEVADRPLPPPRRAYVDALASGLAGACAPAPPPPDTTPSPRGDP